MGRLFLNRTFFAKLIVVLHPKPVFTQKLFSCHKWCFVRVFSMFPSYLLRCRFGAASVGSEQDTKQ